MSMTQLESTTNLRKARNKMKPSKRYETARVIGDYEKLPAGNYVCKVLGVTEKTSQKGNNYFEIGIDIVEGEYAGFYERDWNNNRNEDKKWKGVFRLNVPDDNSEDYIWNNFRTFTDALEESNHDYHFDWNENKWKGLIFGGKFRNEEYDYNGRTGMTVKIAGCCPVGKVRDGSAGIMRDKLLNKKEEKEEILGEFTSAEEEELPFA